MRKTVTKVTSCVKQKLAPNSDSGWRAVLDDLEREISDLQKLGKIVRRKIERGETWPSDATQS
jgi:hypothetical protein